MRSNLIVRGMGHALGSSVLRNSDVARSMGLDDSWFETRTGIVERRGCSEDENVVSLAVQAVGRALSEAGLDPTSLGPETVVLYVQNGFTHLTPPPAILLCRDLGMFDVRPLTLDGVCSEAVNALELAGLMLMQGTCERCIVAASVDFLPMIDSKDPETAGLFGAGAGALIVERSADELSGIRGLKWMCDSRHWELGVIPVNGHSRNAKGVNVEFGYYRMNGGGLAKIALRTLPKVISSVLDESGWKLSDIDRFVTHQPNMKILEIGIRQLGIDRDRVELPVSHTGNLGPASLFVALALAHAGGRVPKGAKVLLLSFGLGFSCSGAALQL